MPDVPGTRLQFAVTRVEGTSLHRGSIRRADGSVITLDDLTSAEMVEIRAALAHAERECWRADGEAVKEQVARGAESVLKAATRKALKPKAKSGARKPTKARRRG